MARRPYAPHPKTAARRETIIQAALACFVELGFTSTTVEDIRRRSKASNGSLYHHFTNKDQLAVAVYLQGLTVYQTGLLEELERHPEAGSGVRAIVRYHLDWVRKHPDWARYLLEMRHAEFMAGSEATIAEQNRRFMERVVRWLETHIESGALRRLPPDLFLSLIIGPCQEYSRLRLAGRAQTKLSVATEELAQAAWLSVRG
jgi:AcrR family transcriptional regulator